MPNEQARKNGNEPAFPVPVAEEGGLTKREYIAALALQGMLASDMSTDRTKANKPVWANAAVEFADALLERLEERMTARGIKKLIVIERMAGQFQPLESGEEIYEEK